MSSILWIIVLGVVFWLLFWLIDYIKLPDPFSKVAKVILAVAAVIFLINVLMGMLGHPLINWR